MFGLKVNFTSKVDWKMSLKMVFVTCSVTKSFGFIAVSVSSLMVNSLRQMPSNICRASLFYIGLAIGSEAKPFKNDGL